jgi:hypothetical protein
LQALFDQRRECNSAPISFLPCAFHQTFVEPHSGSHMSKHTADMSVCQRAAGGAPGAQSRIETSFGWIGRRFERPAHGSQLEPDVDAHGLSARVSHHYPVRKRVR